MKTRKTVGLVGDAAAVVSASQDLLTGDSGKFGTLAIGTDPVENSRLGAALSAAKTADGERRRDSNGC